MKKEAEFSKWFRESLSSNFDLIRLETREEDGIPDIYGLRLSDRTPVFFELKSHILTKKHTIQLQLAPDQKIRLQWLASFNLTRVVCEISSQEVLVIAIGPPIGWNKFFTGAVNVDEALKFDARNKILPKCELLTYLSSLENN